VRGLPRLGIDESDESDTTTMKRTLALLSALLLAPLAAPENFQRLETAQMQSSSHWIEK
jgi:hypothetical protein